MSSRDQWEINVMLSFDKDTAVFLRCSSNSVIGNLPQIPPWSYTSGWEEEMHVDSEEYVWANFLFAVHVTKKFQGYILGCCPPQTVRCLINFLFPWFLSLRLLPEPGMTSSLILMFKCFQFFTVDHKCLSFYEAISYPQIKIWLLLWQIFSNS